MVDKKPQIGDKVYGAPYLPAGGVSTYMGDAPEWEHLAKESKKGDDKEDEKDKKGRR